MKIIVYISLILFFLNSCTSISQEDEWKFVKQTCTKEAYQDFLFKYPRTRHIKEISDSLRVFWKRYNDNLYPHDNGNCLRLLINYQGRILFINRPIEKSELKECIKESILNPNYLVYLPEFKIVKIKNLGTFEVSRAILEIATDKELNTKIYSSIIELVKESFNEIRNDYSQNIWGKSIKDLTPIQLSQIEMIVPINIRFESYDTELRIPPPPLEFSDQEILNLDSDDYEIENSLRK